MITQKYNFAVTSHNTKNKMYILNTATAMQPTSLTVWLSFDAV